MDIRVALVTLILTVPLTLPSVAVIVAEPTPMAATNPLLGTEDDTVAIELLEDCQLTWSVMS
jgi:hypothetical protein